MKPIQLLLEYRELLQSVSNSEVPAQLCIEEHQHAIVLRSEFVGKNILDIFKRKNRHSRVQGSGLLEVVDSRISIRHSYSLYTIIRNIVAHSCVIRSMEVRKKQRLVLKYPI